MYLWAFFCLLLKQVISSNDHEQFSSAIKVLQEQINNYQSLLTENETNPNPIFPESIILVNHAKLDKINEGYKFVLYQDLIKKYISQHGYIPDELKKQVIDTNDRSSRRIAISASIARALLSKQEKSPPRNPKQEIIVRPSRYSDTNICQI